LNPGNRNTSDVNIYPFIIPVIIGSLFIGISIGLKRQKTIYETYTLKFDEAGVTREQINTPSIRLLFNEITNIRKTKYGGLVISSKNQSNSIIILAQIDDMEMIESVLKENCNIPIGISKTLNQLLLIPLVIFVLGLMAVTYISTNKILVSISGVILISIMIWSFVKNQTNKNIDKRTRRSSYVLIMVVLIIIGIIISKLMN
jgi:hypothetical protein